jgi:hypothetical protein
MSDPAPIHVAQAGGVTATVYKIPGFLRTEYRVAVNIPDVGTLDCGPDQLRPARQALEQAEFFIRHEEQVQRMNRCPGCGDG